eukprot:3332387-Pyramimonas_sp.AAC.2
MCGFRVFGLWLAASGSAENPHVPGGGRVHWVSSDPNPTHPLPIGFDIEASGGRCDHVVFA